MRVTIMAVAKTDLRLSGIIKWTIKKTVKIDLGFAWQINLEIYNLCHLSYWLAILTFKIWLGIVDM